MHAFFFGESESPLYGVSHSPTSSKFQNSAILILNPQGHEYIRSHKALRQLADNLSKLGYFVLRFDYQATGDSSGELQNTLLEDWESNIKVAADELRSISGQKNITAIGLRLGASLALLANDKAGFKNTILWDPVISGKDYLKSLLQLQRELLANKNSWFASPISSSDILKNEILGYQYSDVFLNSLKDLDLLTHELPKRIKLKHFHTYTDNSLKCFNSKYDNELKRFFHLEIQDMGDWDDIMKIDSALLVHKITNKIIEEIE